MWENRTFGTDDSDATLTRYVCSNHLQSASLELNEVGEINSKPFDSGVVSSGPADKDIPNIFEALEVNSKQEIGGENAWLRRTDSEYKILNRLANELGGRKRRRLSRSEGQNQPRFRKRILSIVSRRDSTIPTNVPQCKMNFVNGTKY